MKIRLVIGLAATLTLAACGSSSSTDSNTSTPVVENSASAAGFNDADVMFAQMMIPHHEQAIEMSDMALDPSTQASKTVSDLATQIKAAQDPEIKEMKDLLAAWGQPLTAEMDHSSDMDGMLSMDDMQKLGALKGPDFDYFWAQSMIAHHEGAIDMAKVVLDDGSNAEALALANAIVSAQATEIDILKSIPKP
jgi:uncharacterized protein (DUF305 family)